VKKVIFPLEILPVVIVCSSMFTCLISFGILVIAKMIIYHNISSTLYMFVLAMIPLFVLAVGISLFISAISVYLKDVANVISVVITLLMYISPVFFPMSSIPEGMRKLCGINPLTYIIENFRNIVLYGESLDWKLYIISCLTSILFYLIGKYTFMRVKEGFADVL
jgi:lipopolysaccharide transport system permease protein